FRLRPELEAIDVVRQGSRRALIAGVRMEGDALQPALRDRETTPAIPRLHCGAGRRRSGPAARDLQIPASIERGDLHSWPASRDDMIFNGRTAESFDRPPAGACS